MFSYVHVFCFCLWPYFCATSYLAGKSVKVLPAFLPVPVILSISPPLLVWSFTFIEKCDCDKVNLVLSVNSIITLLVKLLQMIRGYVTSVMVCFVFCLYLRKTCLLCMHLILDLEFQLLRGWGVLVKGGGKGGWKISKFKGVPGFMGETKDNFPRGS